MILRQTVEARWHLTNVVSLVPLRAEPSAWMQSYNAFVVQYEKGKTIMEIVEQGDISRRTAYRYKAYYKKLKEKGMAVDKQD